MTERRNNYGLPVIQEEVSKPVPLVLKEALAARVAMRKVLLSSEPSEFWNDLHGAYLSVCITFGLPK